MGFNPSESIYGQAVPTAESQRNEVHETPVDRGDRTAPGAPHDTGSMHQSDSHRPENERRSDKHDDKQNDKHRMAGAELKEVIDAWPGLPQAARIVILAIVQAYTRS